MRRFGAGRERRRRATCAWGPRVWCRRGSAISSPDWPAGRTRCNAAAGRSCKPGPKHYCPPPGPAQMHIPPWLWFRVPFPQDIPTVRDQGRGRPIVPGLGAGTDGREGGWGPLLPFMDPQRHEHLVPFDNWWLATKEWREVTFDFWAELVAGKFIRDLTARETQERQRQEGVKIEDILSGRHDPGFIVRTG